MGRPPNPPPLRVAVSIRGIRKETHLAFKAWCARRGVSMSKAVEEYMESKAREERSLPEERKAATRKAKRYNRKLLVNKRYGARSGPRVRDVKEAKKCASPKSSTPSASPTPAAATTATSPTGITG